MKRIFVLLMTVLLLAVSTQAGALGLAGFGSYANTNDLNDSFGLGGKIDFNLGQSMIFLEGRGTYYPEFKKTILGEELKVSGFPIEFGPGVAFGNLFASAGVSYFILDSDKGSMDDSLGFYIAGGLKRNIQGIGFYLEGMYRVLNSTVETTDDDITINKKDIDLNGFGINLGLSFSF